MKKLYSLIVALLIAQYTLAQWPANYGGVMLQAFYWDSYQDTKWTNLTSQADEISKYFDVLWVPNSGYCGSTRSMGYMPIYWFDHRSAFGYKEYELTDMIKAYNSRGTKLIMDVVLNHKAPLGRGGSWIDFANEQRTGADGTTVYKLTWSGADICNNDDGGDTKNRGWNVTGADDTGDDFGGGRDLDHTSENVRQNCITYMNFLQKELGYSGYRLDMVKGYYPEATKIYNQATNPEFCVGEYWDGNKETLKNWINGTGKTSAVFDFSLKYVIRDAFGGGSWGALADKGLAGTDYSRYAVTFIDNHDTYENQDRLTKNVLAANALILALPGTPCIFLKHWQKYPIAIGNMILARKACGITNQSPIVEASEQDGGYVIKVQGTKGTVLCISGYVQGYNTEGYKLIVSGTNYAYFVSDNITVEGLREGNDMIDENIKPNVYVAVENGVPAPYLYSWTEGGTERSGSWPGTQMTEKVTVNGKEFYKYGFELGPINIILNDGNGNQTANIENLTHDYYFSYSGLTDYTDITASYWTPEVPVCVKPIEGHVYCYFRGNKDYKNPYAWVWNETQNKNFCTDKSFPGDRMKLVGYDNDNYPVYRWDGGELAADAEQPTKILISDNGSNTIRTAELDFRSGNYYDATGYIGTAIIPTGIERVTSQPKDSNAPIYNLQGQRVDAGFRGIAIQNGKKVLMK